MERVDGILYEITSFESPDPYELAAKATNPYEHGEFSRIYKSYPLETRKKINEETDEQFRRVTAFIGKLDPSNPDHKQLIWTWFRMRDVVMELKYVKRTAKDQKGLQKQIDELKAELARLKKEKVDEELIRSIIEKNFYIISAKANEDNLNIRQAIMRFMGAMELHKLTFDKKMISILNSILINVKNNIVDIVLNMLSESIPLFNTSLKAYRDARAVYEKNIEAKESSSLADFLDKYTRSYTMYEAKVKTEVYLEIVKTIRDMFAKATNKDARDLLVSLIEIWCSVVIKFISKPEDWYVLLLCKNYIKINKGFILLAIWYSYNDKTRDLVIRPEIIKIRSNKGPNLEKLLNQIIVNRQVEKLNGIINLPIKKRIYLLDDEVKEKLQSICMGVYPYPFPSSYVLKGSYPTCLINADPQNPLLVPNTVLLNYNNSLAQPIKYPKTDNIWKILIGGPMALQIKNFSV